MQVEWINDIRDRWQASPRWLRFAASILILFLILSLLLGEWLSPDRGFRGAIDEAESALQRGELSRDDGKGALQLYRSVLAIQPDQPDAQQGLVAVREAALLSARQAIAERRYLDAEANIELARELSAGDAELQHLRLALREALSDDEALQEALRQADALAGRGAYFGEAGALRAYRRLLDLAPEFAPAREAREASISKVLQSHRDMLDQGKLSQVQDQLLEVEHADPAHFQLPEAHEALADAQAKQQRWRADMLSRAAKALRRKDWAVAGERFLEVSQREPQDELAKRGLQQASEGLASRAESHLASLRLDAAQRDLDTLKVFGAMPAREQELRRRLIAAAITRERQASVRLSTADARQLRERMTAAIADGRWLAPPGDSAWDHLHRLRTSGLGERQVKQIEKDYLDAAWRCHDDELRENRLREAGACLEAVQTAVPGDTRLIEARASLARRWREWAGERIGKREWSQAEAALRQASRWEPVHPEQVESMKRLQQARATQD